MNAEPLLYPTIRFDSGHTLEWQQLNGDYDLVCPVGGRLFFCHWGMVADLQSNPRRICPHCDEIIGLVTR